MNRVMLGAVLMLQAGLAQVPQQLSLEQAEKIALSNHPAVRASQFTALASGARINQFEAARYPLVTANATAAGAPENTRLAAGAINNPVIYSRMATGVSATQMLLDFGRTSHLVDSARFATQADEERTRFTRSDVLLDVQRAYFSALRADALLRVATETVQSRQILADQVTELVRAQLKSSLDLSFALTSLAEAKLLVSSAKNQRQAALANLAQSMGYAGPQNFELRDEPMPPLEPLSITELTNRAVRERSDLNASRLDAASLRRLTAAEKASRFPTVSATASAGLIPTHVKELRSDFAAVGLNISLPFLNGGLYKARQTEAEFRTNAAEQRARDLENRITRDVTVALLDVNTAIERINLTQQFVDQAVQSLELAQSRYDLGLSSIVELSQAQLVKTNAEIQFATARYEYLSLRSLLFYRAGLLQ